MNNLTNICMSELHSLGWSSDRAIGRALAIIAKATKFESRTKCSGTELKKIGYFVLV